MSAASFLQGWEPCHLRKLNNLCTYIFFTFFQSVINKNNPLPRFHKFTKFQCSLFAWQKERWNWITEGHPGEQVTSGAFYFHAFFYFRSFHFRAVLALWKVQKPPKGENNTPYCRSYCCFNRRRNMLICIIRNFSASDNISDIDTIKINSVSICLSMVLLWLYQSYFWNEFLQFGNGNVNRRSFARLSKNHTRARALSWK